MGVVAVGRMADAVVFEPDVGLVEGRRRDVTADQDFVVGLGRQPEIDAVIARLRIVAHIGVFGGEIAVGQHREVFVLHPLERKDLRFAVVLVVELHVVAHVGRLGGIQPLDRVAVEKQLGAAFAEGGAAAQRLAPRHAARNGAFERVHQRHRIVITRLDNGVGLRKVEHRNVDRPLDKRAAAGRHVVIGLLHGEHPHLVHDAFGVGFGVARRTFAADQVVGTEGFVEGFPRKIVVDTAVVEQHRILLDRVERQRNGHRSTHRFAQVARFEHIGFARHQVAGHAPERHHEPVEIAAGGRRSRRQQFGERQIDLRRRNEMARQHQPRLVLGIAALLLVAQIEPQRKHRGLILHLAVIGGVTRIDAARNPLPNLPRIDDRAHLLRRIARRVERRDDRTHGGSGDVIDRNLVLFERLDHPDMVESLRPSAAQHEPDALGRRPRGKEECNDDKSERFAQHISKNL